MSNKGYQVPVESAEERKKRLAAAAERFGGGSTIQGLSIPASTQEQRIAAHERLQKVREVEKADEVSRRLRAGRFRLTSSGSQKKDWRDS